GLHAGRQYARQVARYSASGDVRQRGHPSTRQNVFQCRGVAKVRLEKLGTNLVSDFGDIRVWFQFRDIKNQLARERVAVGVKPRGWKRDEGVSRLHCFSGEQ